MIGLKDALSILDQAELQPDVESVPLSRSYGRILAEDLVSAIEMPPFDKAAMDGYAINSRDKSQQFRVTGVVAAGDFPERAVGAGEAVRIMTGAPVPKGADQVVVREVSEERGGNVYFSSRNAARNICRQGEDVKPGDLILARGTRMGPAETAVAAAIGRGRLQVFRIPRVGILVTGSEIVSPGGSLKPGQIFDSNSTSIRTHLRQMGVDAVFARRVEDDPQCIRNALRNALEESDLVILSGGVSMGDFDYVPDALESLGVRLHFTRVTIKPGKPTVFGSHEKGFVFGLPGNPVSAFVVFEIMIRPFLYRMMGHVYRPRTVAVPMADTWRRSKVRRTTFLPVRLESGRAVIPDYHGSAHIFALPGADGLLEIPAGVKQLSAKEEVYVRLLGS
ncbi:MAG TPA: molybdopterin molybdenumtransferase MoeA [Candidatus Aminicenantes bacterium]|mgnify:CR=1 FL=1|nr:molybdopterin molybdenumtransferase MoeA [Candidatus Aminicenantes bacterium]